MSCHPLVEAVMEADDFPPGHGKVLPPEPEVRFDAEYEARLRAIPSSVHPAVAAVMADDAYC